MVGVIIFLEGGGDGKELHVRCREGFNKLVRNAGFDGRMPRFVACGARDRAYDRFKTEIERGNREVYPILLVDSEAPIGPDDASGWTHLRDRDGWERPTDADDDQAHLMVAAMETWILADHPTVMAFFPGLYQNALLSEQGLEARPKDEVLRALQHATRHCARQYQKGTLSFDLLGRLDPAILREHLPHFRRFINALDAHL